MTRFKTVAVMGTGTMGPGMGAVLARAGYQVALYDTSAEALERAKAGYELAWGVLDRLETPVVEGGSVRYASDVADALAGAEFVIEAIPENLELKQRVYAEYEQHVGPEVILASNTSGIPATKIAANLAHPERVVVMHWSNPPHLIPMIEIVPGERTNQATIDGTTAVVNDIGYYPCLLKKEVPGFVENRVLYAIMRECLALVDEGVVGLEELDLNVKWGIGYKLAVIPPMQLLDMAGMDIYTAVASYLNPDLSNTAEVSPTIGAQVAKGRLGMKTKGGLFDYTDEQVGRAARPARRSRWSRCARRSASRQRRPPDRRRRRRLGEDLSARPGLAGHRPLGRPVAHRRRDAGPLPGLRRLHRPSRGEVPLRHRVRPGPRQQGAALRAAGADAPADAAGPAGAVRHDARRRSTTSSTRTSTSTTWAATSTCTNATLADQQGRAALVPRAGAVRAARLLRPHLLQRGQAKVRVPRG